MAKAADTTSPSNCISGAVKGVCEASVCGLTPTRPGKRKAYEFLGILALELCCRDFGGLMKPTVYEPSRIFARLVTEAPGGLNRYSAGILTKLQATRVAWFLKWRRCTAVSIGIPPTASSVIESSISLLMLPLASPILAYRSPFPVQLPVLSPITSNVVGSMAFSTSVIVVFFSVLRLDFIVDC